MAVWDLNSNLDVFSMQTFLRGLISSSSGESSSSSSSSSSISLSDDSFSSDSIFAFFAGLP
jgi:hypothetical protein